jgi:membrane-bound lytic murein transglycosylase B
MNKEIGRAALRLSLVTWTIAWLALTPATAQPQPDFPGWLAGVRADALARGIRPQTLDQALADAHPIDRVIELDRHQPEFTVSFSRYMKAVVSPVRVKSGRKQLAQHRALLSAVSKRYGVPSKMIVAMWGIESDFGRATGGFSVVPALLTLAYDGRRSQYFRNELMNALEIIDRGIPVERMRGSWAGAMGQCQFMPSTYLKFAQGWASDHQPDIWSRQPDVFASTANYLAQSGWNARQHWGRPVRLPKGGIAPSDFGLDVHKSLTEWSRLGVRSADGGPLPRADHIEASLVRAEGGKGNDSGHGPPYLVYDNFRVIMQWNRSVLFAIAAGTLADRIGSR